MIDSRLPSTPTGRKSYKSLKHLIKVQVKDGQFAAHERLPSMRKLCDTYEISLATVQRALSELCDESVLYSQRGRGTFVAPIRKESRCVGLLCGMGIPSLQESMFGPLMQVLQESALADSKSVSVFNVTAKNKGQYKYLDIQDVTRHELDVLILINVVNLGLISSLKQLGIPIIATDLDGTDIGVHSVFFDNEAASFDMTMKLIEDGHKDIWFIGGLECADPRYDLCLRQRYTGYRLACRAKGIKPSVTVTMKKQSSGQQFSGLIEDALSTNPPPTAVIAENGKVVSSIFENLSVPIDLACWNGEASAEGMTSRVRYLASCDFAKLGVESYKLLRQLDEGLETPMARIMIESQILTNPTYEKTESIV